jgi:hypothetical protein
MKETTTNGEEQGSTSASTPSGTYEQSTGNPAPEGAGTEASPPESDFAMRVESVAGSRPSVRFHIDVEEQQERRTLAKLNSRLQRIKQR